jgi:uncharacterized membrane protein
MLNESDRHFVHRLEAFSDIVIGFSLAQLGVSLTVPANGAALLSNPSWFFGFIFAFAVVCSMWFFHHRLFSTCFVPTFWPVLLNFVWLAILVLLVFVTQVNVRVNDLIVVSMYFGIYALAYAILGVQYVIALPVNRERARAGAAFMFLWVAPFAVSFLATTMLPPSNLTGIIILAAFAATTIASSLLGSRYRRQRRAREQRTPQGSAQPSPSE